MGLISRLVNFVTGTTISSSEVNGEYDQILGVLNGNIDTDNIGTVAISAIANLGSEHNDSGTHKDISTTGITSTGVVSVTRATVFDNTFAGKVAADSFSRFAVVAGAVSLGGGAAAPDVRFLRLAAKSIRFDDGAGGSINEGNFLCTSDKITHSVTTKSIAFGFAAVVPDTTDPVDVSRVGAGCLPTAVGAVDYGVIDLNRLPNGVELDAFGLYVTRQAGGTITAKIFKLANGAGSATQIGSTITINSGTGALFSSITDIGEVIDTTSNSYHIELGLLATTAVSEAIFTKAELSIESSNLSQV